MHQMFVAFYYWVVFHCMDVNICMSIRQLKDIWVVFHLLVITDKATEKFYLKILHFSLLFFLNYFFHMIEGMG